MPHLLAEARPCCFTATNATSCQTLGGRGCSKDRKRNKELSWGQKIEKDKKQRIDLSETGNKSPCISYHSLAPMFQVWS